MGTAFSAKILLPVFSNDGSARQDLGCRQQYQQSIFFAPRQPFNHVTWTGKAFDIINHESCIVERRIRVVQKLVAAAIIIYGIKKRHQIIILKTYLMDMS